jgi:cyclic beta-1,2-glucan synthetase
VTEAQNGRSVPDAAAGLGATDSGCRVGGPERLSARIRALSAGLREADLRLSLAGELPETGQGALEWILDNWYIIEEATRQVEQGLPQRFLRELPRVRSGPDDGLPRALRLARLLLAESGDFLDLADAAHRIERYQEHAVLTIGELWALPNLLRFAVLETLARCTVTLLAGGAAVADRSPPAPLETRVAGCVTTLRRLAAHDWKAFVERLSVVEALLRGEPGGAHALGDFATRDRYRKAVEQLARWSGVSEPDAARAAVEQCRSAPATDRRGHVGFHLVDRGRPALEARLGAGVPRPIRARRFGEHHATTLYVGGVCLLAAALLAIAVMVLLRNGGTAVHLLLLLLVAAIPAFGIAVPVINWLVTHLFPPRTLPRLDFDEAIPTECRTAVVVPALLASRHDVDAMLRQIEVNYQGNADPQLLMVLLTDGPDSPEPRSAADAELLAAATAGISRLNERYGSPPHLPFMLLWRERRWNPAEGCWMGYERKRGKLQEFNRLLLGDERTDLEVRCGDRSALRGVRFVITLDADTVLPQRAAARLSGTLAHPLNVAETDAHGRVIAGYTVLQPRVDVAVRGAGETPFARLYEGETGLDLYTHAVSDAYHDLFGEGIFAGKGIYEVASFERSLHESIPENALLSHDLFEGVHGRAGFASDVQLFEDYPSHVIGYARRLHRWVRGDWQLLPWLLFAVPGAAGRRLPNRLSALSRWKIADNLRRSLTAPALVAFLLAGWLALPGPPWLWTIMATFTLAIPIFLGTATAASRLVAGAPWRPTVKRALWGGGVDVLRWFTGLAFLAFEAALVADAVTRTLARLFVTRRHLLEWQSAALTARLVARSSGIRFAWQQMAASPVTALAGAAALAILRPAAWPAALPLLLAWLTAPRLAHHLSQTRARAVALLQPLERDRLRRLARRTWYYFEQVLSPDDLWLAPDNLQEAPVAALVHRTSPTNIGMSLLAALSALDLGYLGIRSATTTLHNIVDGLVRLDRFRGHYLNWYDTRTAAVLAPRYVSTVDSGNLAASLIALEQGCHEMMAAPVVAPALFKGLGDTAAVLREEVARLEQDDPAVTILRDLLYRTMSACRTPPSTLPEQRKLLEQLRRNHLPEINNALANAIEALSAAAPGGTRLRELRVWFERLRAQTDRVVLEYDTMAPWAAVAADAPPGILATDSALARAWAALSTRLDAAPALEELGSVDDETLPLLASVEAAMLDPGLEASVPEAARKWLAKLAGSLRAAATAGEHALAELRGIAEEAARLVREMDFTFLFDRQRRLFHIGYDVDTTRLDGSYYDLLASEARLASIIAIAKRDVPEQHWLFLGRPFGRSAGQRVLLSWGGSMFEFLMPALLTELPDDTLLTAACHTALGVQRRFAVGHGIPWGVSESSFHQITPDGHYSYRAFGVPGLGLRRDLGERLVVAPYATALAISLDPRAVAANVERLVELGGLGTFGLYEALDFGRREAPERRPAVVRAWMSHHQGMILVALANHMCGNPMVRRFHNDPRIASIEYLLFEQVPRHVSIQRVASRQLRGAPVRRLRYEGWSVEPLGSTPNVHLLSNGRYSVVASAAGGGGSRWRGRALTRWRAETGVDQWGHWLYVQDRDSGELWSVARQPVLDAAVETATRFSAEAVEYRARAHGIAARAVITVAPDEDVEICRVTLTNETGNARSLALTSYMEVALARPGDDLRHQAFAKLFVESEIVAELGATLFRRRPGGPDSEPLWLGHMISAPLGNDLDLSFETDRAAFLGPGGTARAPAALAPGAQLAGGAGATLDPCAAVRCPFELEAGRELTLACITTAAASREEVVARLTAFGSRSRIDRVCEEAASRAEAELAGLGIAPGDLHIIQRIFSLLLAPDPRARTTPDVLAAAHSSQSSLWRFGLSGDRPILLVRAGGEGGEELAALRTALQASALLRRRGCEIDLVIMDRVSAGYLQPFYERITAMVVEAGLEAWLQRPGGVFIVRVGEMQDADSLLLESAARVVLDTRNGSAAEQLARLDTPPSRLPAFSPVRDAAQPEAEVGLADGEELLLESGFGGFTPDGREYVLRLREGQRTPRSWINVVANPHFGFTISATGGGYTWAVNSAERRLTPWRNDPVGDAPGEVVYLRDEADGRVWSATPEPAATPGPWEIRFGAGHATFIHAAHGLLHRLRLHTTVEDQVKVFELTVENHTDRLRRLTATCYVEWVLGTSRHRTLAHLVPDYAAAEQVLLARNPFDPAFGPRTAFLSSSEPVHGLTSDRIEFAGEAGDLSRPAALYRVGPAGTVRPGGDCCGALQVYLQLEPGEKRTVRFFLGDAADRGSALELARRYREPAAALHAWDESQARWDALLGRVQVRTGDQALDLLLNRWLLYQMLACRLWGRSALGQSGGAFGFRDQLQDVMAVAAIEPSIARSHILEAARHQFEQGDVLHWWHPGGGQGVRTRCSDDLLWLPWAAAHYANVTGDHGIFDETVPFLVAEPLRDDEADRYGHFSPAPEGTALYQHCIAALEHAARFGVHGLPLFGAGDWNDGMNRVGVKGRGESVWLAWFMASACRDFAAVCECRGDEPRASRLRQRAAALVAAVEAHGWDGDWYLRGFYDDGAPLGSARSDECRIDSVAQSWAVMSGLGRGDRASAAMQAVLEKLADRELGLVRLFDPPFDRPARDPGYIKAYPPGVRENGGQYTHAAVWVAWAAGVQGDGDRLMELLSWLSPAHRAATPEGAARYRGEPWALAADISTTPRHRGAAGWTWYTGSAGWLYRLGMEVLLGLTRRADKLHIAPCLPRGWEGFDAVWREGAAEYRISVRNPQRAGRGVASITLDGEPVQGTAIPLDTEPGIHQVVVVLGAPVTDPEIA